MAKENEIAYLDAWVKSHGDVDSGQVLQAVLDKPFTWGGDCGRHFADIGRIMQLLPAAPARILDLGVGSGWTSVMYARNGYDVFGQDISPSMIALAEKSLGKHPGLKLRFAVSDYETLGMPGEFDAAVFYDSLHHSVDEEAALRAVFAALKPGGILIALEPGAGHSTCEDTLETVAKYGVTEKDMPPRLIFEAGHKVGFRSGVIYVQSILPIAAYEQDNPPPAPVPPPLQPIDRRGKLRRAGSFLMGSWRVLTNPLPVEIAPPPAPEAAEDPTAILLRSRNIVTMRKPA